VNVPEAPRFFEAMVVGRHGNEISYIVSRILRHLLHRPHVRLVEASEAANGIQITPQTRLLAPHPDARGELPEPHLHVFFLVAP